MLRAAGSTSASGSDVDEVALRRGNRAAAGRALKSLI
jgi:hypothetical protein